MTRAEYDIAIETLNKHTKLFDQGTPEIDDVDWDALYFDCEAYEKESGYINPKSPTSTIVYDIKNSLNKITHNHPMLSLDKTKDINVLRKWLVHKSVIMAKMDGLTCSIKYVNGKLFSAETRGNGVIGEDILHNANVIASIPKTIDKLDDTVIDGEIICKFDDFESFSDVYKNPRNFAAGSIRLLDSKECSSRKLTFVAWDMISSTDTLSNRLAELISLGFVVTPYEYVNLNDLEGQIDKLRQISAKLNYPIDGLVYKIDDYETYMSKGKNDHSFLGGLAFKVSDDLYETELLDIDWSIGRTGVLTPVAVFKAVDIDGVTVQRASMHNITIMQDILGLKPFVGQRIWVCRANMVIPQVIKADKSN